MTPADFGRRLRDLGLQAGDIIDLRAGPQGTEFTMARDNAAAAVSLPLAEDRVIYRISFETRRLGLSAYVDRLDDATTIRIEGTEA